MIPPLEKLSKTSSKEDEAEVLLLPNNNSRIRQREQHNWRQHLRQQQLFGGCTNNGYNLFIGGSSSSILGLLLLLLMLTLMSMSMWWSSTWISSTLVIPTVEGCVSTRDPAIITPPSLYPVSSGLVGEREKQNRDQKEEKEDQELVVSKETLKMKKEKASVDAVAEVIAEQQWHKQKQQQKHDKSKAGNFPASPLTIASRIAAPSMEKGTKNIDKNNKNSNFFLGEKQWSSGKRTIAESASATTGANRSKENTGGQKTDPKMSPIVTDNNEGNEIKLEQKKKGSDSIEQKMKTMGNKKKRGWWKKVAAAADVKIASTTSDVFFPLSSSYSCS